MEFEKSPEQGGTDVVDIIILYPSFKPTEVQVFEENSERDLSNTPSPIAPLADLEENLDNSIVNKMFAESPERDTAWSLNPVSPHESWLHPFPCRKFIQPYDNFLVLHKIVGWFNTGQSSPRMPVPEHPTGTNFILTGSAFTPEDEHSGHVDQVFDALSSRNFFKEARASHCNIVWNHCAFGSHPWFDTGQKDIIHMTYYGIAKLLAINTISIAEINSSGNVAVCRRIHSDYIFDPSLIHAHGNLANNALNIFAKGKDSDNSFAAIPLNMWLLFELVFPGKLGIPTDIWFDSLVIVHDHNEEDRRSVPSNFFELATCCAVITEIEELSKGGLLNILQLFCTADSICYLYPYDPGPRLLLGHDCKHVGGVELVVAGSGNLLQSFAMLKLVGESAESSFVYSFDGVTTSLVEYYTIDQLKHFFYGRALAQIEKCAKSDQRSSTKVLYATQSLRVDEQLDVSSRITLPFDPGARLKHDQCKNSLLENERGILNDRIDRKLVVSEKYLELAGKSVLADVFLHMHCYTLQTEADLLHTLNMEQTGSSLVFALGHNQYFSIFAEFTWLMEWMQYSLFGGSLLRDDSSAIALAMDRFSTQLQEFHVKMVERLHKVLEFVSAIHDLCAVLGIDDTIVRAGGTRNIVAVFLSSFVELNTKVNSALSSKLHVVLTIGVLALPSSSLKDFFDALSVVSGCILCLAKHNERFVVSLGLRIVTRLPLKDIAVQYVSLNESITFPPLTLFYCNLAILYALFFHPKVGDFCIFIDSLILEDHFDSILSGLLHVHTLTLTGYIDHVTSSYMIKVWDPGRKWCTHSCILKCGFALTFATSLSDDYSSNHLDISTPNRERMKKKSKDLSVYSYRFKSFIQAICWPIVLIARAQISNDTMNFADYSKSVLLGYYRTWVYNRAMVNTHSSILVVLSYKGESENLDKIVLIAMNYIALLGATIGSRDCCAQFALIQTGAQCPLKIIGRRLYDHLLKELSAYNWSYKIGVDGLVNHLFAGNSHLFVYSVTKGMFAVEELYEFSQEGDIWLVGTFAEVIHDLYSSPDKFTVMKFVMNLEDKVLIEGGSIVMNGPKGVLANGLVDRSMCQHQPKISLSVYIWDPGPSSYELKETRHFQQGIMQIVKMLRHSLIFSSPILS